MVRPAPGVVRAAGILVGVEGLAGVGYGVALVAYALSGAPRPGNVIAQAAFFALLTAGVAAVAAGLVTGRRWARTPAIVLQLLLLPIVYTVLGPNHQLVAGAVAVALVVATFLLLISERSRQWAVDADLDREAGPDAGADGG